MSFDQARNYGTPRIPLRKGRYVHGSQYREVIENVEIFAYLGKIRPKDKPTTDMKVEDMEDISFLKNIDLQTNVKLSLSI